MIILLYISSVLFNACGDGLNDKGSKGIGHVLQALAFIPLLFDNPIWWVAISSYVLLNIALFDYAYNISRGLSWNYVGTTSWWDQAIAKVPFGFMLIVRLLSLIVGIFLILNND
jgi:hypothetical protein